jgi:hypothetical protein
MLGYGVELSPWIMAIITRTRLKHGTKVIQESNNMSTLIGLFQAICCALFAVHDGNYFI